MSDDRTARSGALPRAGRTPVGGVRWGMRAVSYGLLLAATMMGVQFGLSGPLVSPVAPTVDTTTAEATTVGRTIVSADAAQTVPSGHGSKQRGAVGHD